MTGAGQSKTSVAVLGQEISSPVIVGPTSLHRLVDEEGEVATARAAKRAQTLYTMSVAASLPIETISSQSGPWWMQMYIFRNRELTADLVRTAVEHGASAIVLTVDLARFGRREADDRNAFSLPAGTGPVNLSSQPDTVHSPANPSNLLPTFGGEFESALTWDDLEWMVDVAGVPVIVKGILHPDDARLAVEHGASGIVVSNHGGRQLDGAIASLDALPAIADAVGDKTEILLDGGIRRASDIITALSLGARAVMIGRPVLWGLAVDGEAGVYNVLELLRQELDIDLMLCGLASVQEIERSLLVRANQ